MKRRDFIRLVGGLAVWPLAARAQQAAQRRIIGVLGTATPSGWSQWTSAFVQRFRELGFTVLAHENATKKTMEAAIIDFGRRLAGGGVGALYYAGHGLQVKGRNDLVPVDADIEDEATIRVAAVDVELLLEQMAEAKNRVSIVMLDACRNNPFERRMRGASRGLAAIELSPGTPYVYRVWMRPSTGLAAWASGPSCGPARSPS